MAENQKGGVGLTGLTIPPMRATVKEEQTPCPSHTYSWLRGSDTTLTWEGTNAQVLEGGILLESFTTPSLIRRVVRATFQECNNKPSLCMLHNDGLQVATGGEVVSIALPSPSVDMWPMSQGLLLQCRGGLYSLMHPLDGPLPVAKLSKEGRGNPVRSDLQLVFAQGSLVVLWDGRSKRHSIHVAHVTADRYQNQSYQRVLDASVSGDASDFVLSHVSLFDTFTVLPPTDQRDSEVFLRRIYTDPHRSLGPAPGVHVVGSQLLLLLEDGLLRAINIRPETAHKQSEKEEEGGYLTSCTLAFELFRVSRFVPLDREFFLSQSATGELTLHHGGTRLSSLEFDPTSSQTGPADNSSCMSISSEEEDEGGEASNSSTLLMHQPPLLHHCGREGHFILRTPSHQRLLQLCLTPASPLAVQLLRIVRGVLPPPTCVLFAADFCQTRTALPSLCEFDQMACLLLSALHFDFSAVENASSALQQLISSARHTIVAAKLGAQLMHRLAPPAFLSFPAEWKAVPVTLLTPVSTVQAHARELLQALHALYEESKLGPGVDTSLLRPLLLVIAQQCHCDRYVHHYLYDDARLAHLLQALPPAPKLHHLGPPLTPFSLLRHLVDYRRLQQPSQSAWVGAVPTGVALGPMLQSTLELWTLLYGNDPQRRALHRELEARHIPTPPLALFDCIPVHQSSSSPLPLWPMASAMRLCRTDSERIVCFAGYTLLRHEGWKSPLPLALIEAVLAHATTVRDCPPEGWPPFLYRLLERADLYADATALQQGTVLSKSSYGDADRRAREKEAGVFLSSSVPHHRFPKDRRIEEMQRLLGIWATMALSVPQQPGVSDHDHLQQQQIAVVTHISKLGAKSVGRGMFTFCADEDLLQNVANWQTKIPAIPRQMKVMETKSTVVVEEATLPAGFFDYLDFHTGVAAALRISNANPQAQTRVGDSWIAYNKPSDKSPHQEQINHAGFLFGLGLTGQLSSLSPVRLFDYFVRHTNQPLTTVGLLLGIAATHRGTMDNQVTKLLSVHLPAMHPPQSADLEVPPAPRVAALMGLGLLYCQSQHMRITEVLLNEMDFQASDDRSFCREAHSLAAGLALGWTNLCCGTAQHASTLENRLMRFIAGGDEVSHIAPGKSSLVRPSLHTDTNLTAVPATLALGLMFLQSNNASVAHRLRIPPTLYLLDYVRADHLLVRCLCRTLIMWTAAEPTEQWLQSHIPQSIWLRGDTDQPKYPNESDDENSRLIHQAQLARLYCVAGCLFGLAITQAGTGNLACRDFVMGWIQHFRSAAVTVDVQVAEVCLQTSCLAIGIVMAGSGDLEVLRLLRGLTFRTPPSLAYGSHMAMHMALGMLFLSGCQQTFCRTPTAVAALVTSCFPVFPLSPIDGTFHLQALRHLWVLACQPRCLAVLDAVSKQFVPAQVYVNNDPSPLSSPCLLPEHLLALRIESPLHFPSTTLPSSSPPWRLYIQPRSPLFDCPAAVSALYSLPPSAHKGWHLGLLTAGSLSPLALPAAAYLWKGVGQHAQRLFKQHYLDGSFLCDSPQDALLFSCLFAGCVLPPHWAVADMRHTFSSPFALCLASEGAISFSACKILSTLLN